MENREEIESAGLSRRSFLTAAAIGTAGVLGTGLLAGCSSKPNAVESSSAMNSTASTTESEVAPTGNKYSIADASLEADVVVVGSGGAGLSAAIQSRQLGLNTVLLEKNKTAGGSSMYTEGVFGLGSHWQKEAGITTTVGEALVKTMAYHHWNANADLTRVFFEKSGDTISWLEDLGVEFGMVIGVGDSLESWHRHKNLGSDYIAALTEAAVSAGVDIHYGVSADGLIFEQGALTGVGATSDNSDELVIKSPVVILATGGYADNASMMKELAGMDVNNCVQTGVPGRDGDGINMAQSIGGVCANYAGTVMCYGGIIEGDEFGSQLYVLSTAEPVMWVNQNGERFADEVLSSTNFSFAGAAMQQQEKVYSIMPKSYIDACVNEGCIVGNAAQGLPAGTKFDKVYEQIETFLNREIFVADSIKELAAAIDVDPEGLQATIDAQNEMHALGADTSYGKDPQYLVPFNEGPYYAFHLKLGYFATVGGLKVSTDAQVLDAQNEPLPGVYAAGGDAGGLYGDSYDVGIAIGSQQGWAVNSGRMAAQHAATYLS